MIKVGFCVSYDWEFLKHSIPRVYQEADIICLALDKDRHSWKCNPYQFDDDAFYSFVKSIDTQNKIDIYEDDFSMSELNSRENCNRHRMMIADRMGKGGWHIQVDSDEYFLDFSGFVQELKKIYKNPTENEFPINVCCPFIPLFKKTENGYLYVDTSNNFPEIIPVATNKPNYERARQNGYFNIYTKSYVIHDTWARSEAEMKYKIDNWGHAAEELHATEIRNAYFNLWKTTNEFNYQYLYNFHPASPKVWEQLSYIEANNIDELIQNLKIPKFPLSNLQLAFKNSINYSRLAKIFPFLRIG
ncbi:MAG TPA: hypothetical protein PKZ66_05650 [Chitinophagaceae bacterium]|nr:hypothetical protein [Chitinophagaceae bacterium]